MSQLSTLSRDNLTDAVIQEIQQMILCGAVMPGGWLMPQPELARQLGVGLSTVREAVKGLTLLGVLSPQPGRGTYVNDDALPLLRMLNLLKTRLSDLDLETLYETRALLEVTITELAAERATQDQINQIAAALDRMRAAGDDDHAFHEADLAFHLAVAAAARNPLLEQFFHITANLMTAVNEQFSGIPGMKEAGLQLQAEIYAAICVHDVKRARRKTLALLQRWREILRAVQAIRESELVAAG
jgi:DNA-binding FadR family transcriptional regulator